MLSIVSAVVQCCRFASDHEAAMRTYRAQHRYVVSGVELRRAPMASFKMRSEGFFFWTDVAGDGPRNVPDRADVDTITVILDS